MKTIIENKRILLISNSTLHGSGYLDHAEGEIRNFLGSTVEFSSSLSLCMTGIICSEGPKSFQNDGL